MLKLMLAVAVFCLLVVPAFVALAEADELPGVVPLAMRPDDAAFEGATATRPIQLASADVAKKYFTEDQIKELNTKVDWTEQRVLVFAWRGSGGDTHTGSVVEKDGKAAVRFGYSRGRTRDLRPHTRVYAVDKGLGWSVETIVAYAAGL